MKRIISSILTVALLTTQFSFADMKLVRTEKNQSMYDLTLSSFINIDEEFDKATENKLKNIKVSGETRAEKVHNIAKTINDMGLTYGGNMFEQYNLSDGKTMCSGSTLLFTRLLTKTDVPFRLVNIQKYDPETNGVTAEGKRHTTVQVKLDDDKWYVLETTYLLYKNQRVIDEKFYFYDMKVAEEKGYFSKDYYDAMLLSGVYVGTKLVDKTNLLYKLK